MATIIGRWVHRSREGVDVACTRGGFSKAPLLAIELPVKSRFRWVQSFGPSWPTTFSRMVVRDWKGQGWDEGFFTGRALDLAGRMQLLGAEFVYRNK